MAENLRSFPSFKSLAAFRAVGTHLNMTRAADDLNVTREAISVQIRNLETHVGKPLFYRRHRGLEFTEAGKKLHDAVAESFRIIARTLRDVRDQETRPSVKITTTVAFAGSTFLSRLADFHATHPEIDIRLVESDIRLNLDEDGIDLAIRYGEGKWPGVISVHLFDEETFPVCSPALAYANPLIKDMNNIPSFRLLHLDGPAHASEDWANLFNLAGVENNGNLGGLWFSDYSNVLSAAREGKGVAIGWSHVVDHYLRAGELVNPTGRSFRTGKGFYLLKPDSRSLSDPAQVLHNWILEIFTEMSNIGDEGEAVGTVRANRLEPGRAAT